MLKVSALGLVVAPATGLADTRTSAAAAPLRQDPFTLGVASGDPAPDGFVIWTRLALDPFAADGLGGFGGGVARKEWLLALEGVLTPTLDFG